VGSQSGAPLSFYIHIPYCVKRCGYCDFNTYTPAELQITEGLAEISHSYIDLLIEEARLARTNNLSAGTIPTIFFGGGTPTLMEPEDLNRILNQLKSEFGFAEDIEITIEANPDTITKEKLAALRAIGINRISIGMQSATPHVLKTLDRTHNPENVGKAVAWAREVGFEQISVDLIYGTPGESLADWQSTIESALSLPITHISAYALIVEEGTKFAAQVKRGEVDAPDDDLMADKYLLADQLFAAAGLHWYELSNWSLPGGECRHNIAYWQGDNWWGLGPGAHSHIAGKRWWNVKHPSTYRDRLAGQESPINESESLTDIEIENERVMLQIRLSSGISKSTLSKEIINRLLPFLHGGELDGSCWASGDVVLTLKGRLVADRIVREILL
jgi:oxygen-independent coproporphyrinogen-3 oxidase